MTGAYVAMIDADDLHFAVLAVTDGALQSQKLVDEIVAEGVVRLGRPIVLLGIDDHRVYGPPRIKEYLHYIAPHMLPWQRMAWSEAPEAQTQYPCAAFAACGASELFVS